MTGRGAGSGGDSIGAGGRAAQPRAIWTVPCVVAAMVASLFLGDPADASRDEARRRAGRAIAARVVADAAGDPAVSRSVPELVDFARALAEGRMADATRIGDRLAADPTAMATAADEVGAAQLEGPALDAACALVRRLQAAFAGFPSVTAVFVSLLARFGCPPGPGGSTTTSVLGGSTTTVAPNTTMTGPTLPPGPTTTLPVCQPTTPGATTIPCTTTTTLPVGSSTTFPFPSTTSTTGGPGTTGPTTTLPFCIPNNPVTTTVPCRPLP